jgi:hypothetical protein
MPVISRINDTTHAKNGLWAVVTHKGPKNSRIVVLDGSGGINSQGELISCLSLGDQFNVSKHVLDMTKGEFVKFPVRAHGVSTPLNPGGEYEITAKDQPPVTIKNGPAQGPFVPGNSPTPSSGATTTGVTARSKTPTGPTAAAITGKDGVPVVNVDAISSFLAAIPVEQSMMIWGPSGVGKSMGVHEFCLETGKKLFDVRLPLLDPIDLRGIGVPDISDPNDRKCVWLRPEFIPNEPNCVLFLDEITAAPPSLQALAYQLTLDRMVGDHSLPPDCLVICAGNRVTDRGVAYTMPSPLANRLFHLEIKADLQAWKNWAIRSAIDPRIISFLQVHPTLLHKMDPDQAGQAWPSPRSWAFASRMLSTNLSNDQKGIAIAGCVGVAAAREFIRHCVNYHALESTMENIINGLTPNYKESDPTKAQTLAVAVAANVTSDTTQLNNVVSWAAKQNGEFAAVLIRTLEERFGLEVLTPIRSYALWAATNPRPQS